MEPNEIDQKGFKKANLEKSVKLKPFKLLIASKQAEQVGNHVLDNRVQREEIANEIIKWHNFAMYKKKYGVEIEEIDLSIVCQLSQNLPVAPSRTQQCPLSCIVDRHFLETQKVCACGRQIDEENGIVQDKPLYNLVSYCKDKYWERGIIVKTVRLFIKKKDFQGINQDGKLV